MSRHSRMTHPNATRILCLLALALAPAAPARGADAPGPALPDKDGAVTIPAQE